MALKHLLLLILERKADPLCTEIIVKVTISGSEPSMLGSLELHVSCRNANGYKCANIDLLGVKGEALENLGDSQDLRIQNS